MISTSWRAAPSGILFSTAPRRSWRHQAPEIFGMVESSASRLTTKAQPWVVCSILPSNAAKLVPWGRNASIHLAQNVHPASLATTKIARAPFDAGRARSTLGSTTREQRRCVSVGAVTHIRQHAIRLHNPQLRHAIVMMITTSAFTLPSCDHAASALVEPFAPMTAHGALCGILPSSSAQKSGGASTTHTHTLGLTREMHSSGRGTHFGEGQRLCLVGSCVARRR